MPGVVTVGCPPTRDEVDEPIAPEAITSYESPTLRSSGAIAVLNAMRSTVVCQSESKRLPALYTMPRPQWNGMRPKRRSPTGVAYSAHARFTSSELRSEFTPAVGGVCVFEKSAIGA